MSEAPAPSRLKNPGEELDELLPAAHGLAKMLRQSIRRARRLRHAVGQHEFKHGSEEARRQAASTAKEPLPTGEVLRTKASKATLSASKLLGQMLDIKSRIEISLLRSGGRYDSFRQAFERLTLATDAPASNTWPATLSFDEEGTLHGVDRLEMLLEAIPRTAHERPREIELSRTLKNGQFCDRVIEEIRKIRHLHPAYTVAQIGADHPDFLVWAIVDHPDTDAEDQDIFFHPMRWGPVVGYAIKLLARHFGKSEATIERWRKAYRKLSRNAPKAAR